MGRVYTRIDRTRLDTCQLDMIDMNPALGQSGSLLHMVLQKIKGSAKIIAVCIKVSYVTKH